MKTAIAYKMMDLTLVLAMDFEYPYGFGVSRSQSNRKFFWYSTIRNLPQYFRNAVKASNVIILFMVMRSPELIFVTVGRLQLAQS